jgi:hypothetical protein
MITLKSIQKIFDEYETKMYKRPYAILMGKDVYECLKMSFEKFIGFQIDTIDSISGVKIFVEKFMEPNEYILLTKKQWDELTKARYAIPKWKKQ